MVPSPSLLLYDAVTVLRGSRCATLARVGEADFYVSLLQSSLALVYRVRLLLLLLLSLWFEGLLSLLDVIGGMLVWRAELVSS